MQMKQIQLPEQEQHQIRLKLSKQIVIVNKGEFLMGKKHRNRINSPKKNNHIPPEGIIAEQEAHGKEYSAKKRKNSPGSNVE